jgi:hypothetical protein
MVCAKWIGLDSFQAESLPVDHTTRETLPFALINLLKV